MADNARGIHVSPGIYTREIDMQYAIKSLGITTLGVAGETLKGPAFQVMDIANWREYQDVFGGTSVEKFKGSQYPKYELPYIAKSYLTESEQLKVVRVLGLSGYNAGPAWIVTANNQAVAVIRSRGTYKPYETGSTTNCACEPSKYDTLSYYVGEKPKTTSDCTTSDYNLNALEISAYTPFDSDGDECTGHNNKGGSASYNISQTNHGRFTLIGLTGRTSSAVTATTPDFKYAVSLNPYDKDYILKVLGTNQHDGDAPIYVETLYDVALDQGIAEGRLTSIDSALSGINAYHTADYCHHEPVNGIISLPASSLRRKHVGMRFLANGTSATDKIPAVPYNYGTGKPITKFDIFGEKGITDNASISAAVESYAQGDVSATYSANTVSSVNNIVTPTLTIKYGEGEPYPTFAKAKEALITERKATPIEMKVIAGQIYTVKQYTTEDGKRHYYYAYNAKENVDTFVTPYTTASKSLDTTNLYGNLLSGGTSGVTGDTTAINMKAQYATLVLNQADGLYYRMDGGAVKYVTLDINDYKSAYRYASTPWIVSNLKGDYKHIELNKLFRFHTISDGNNSNYEIKISIENIRPDSGVFDVVVRDINDTDEAVMVLERFGQCSMIPGDSNYIGYKIGTFDGVYESKSKYITVEINESTAAKNSIPAGFLGYPRPKYGGLPITGNNNTTIKYPTLAYNRYYDPDIKNRKQYFGLSSWIGVDIDNFTFKGNKTYIDLPEFRGDGFHLDSRLDKSKGGVSSITVDGVSGDTFESVSINSTTPTLSNPPIIGKESEMYGTIYENVNLRKFTMYFYGGFDGWDEYRDERTITDDYKLSQYRGFINQGSGEGYSFDKIANPEALGLNQAGITSDWYAYLAGIRQFANPEATDINVFATPGIDYVNNKLLVEEAIEMIEEERADSIYVITTPDKPRGAGDYVDEMYTPDEAVYNLEETDIDSNYSCTYYPWVKYLDEANNQYIYLPATKDAVRNFAQTDNDKFPWFAPAGIERGGVDCVRAHFITKLADEDVLYEGRINPIKTFAQDGPKIWGQKNLQVNESQLNRIAVRRLLLRMRKLIAIACIGLIFEPNDPTVKQSFMSAVTPIMENIRSNRGISDYRIEINDSIESRERRELPVKIYFKPYNALEYITIDFVLTPEGVSFDQI